MGPAQLNELGLQSQTDVLSGAAPSLATPGPAGSVMPHCVSMPLPPQWRGRELVRGPGQPPTWGLNLGSSTRDPLGVGLGGHKSNSLFLVCNVPLTPLVPGTQLRAQAQRPYTRLSSPCHPPHLPVSQFPLCYNPSEVSRKSLLYTNQRGEF